MTSIRNRIATSVVGLALIASMSVVSSTPAAAGSGGCSAAFIESSEVANAHYARSLCSTLTNGTEQRARLYVNFGTGDKFGAWQFRQNFYSTSDKHRYGGGAGYNTRY